MARILCFFGVHQFVGVTSYCQEPIEGYRLVFHKSVCSRCNVVRERMLPPISPGEDVDLELKFGKTLRQIFGGKP